MSVSGRNEHGTLGSFFLERVPHQNWGTNIARKTAHYIRALRPTPNVELSREETNLVSKVHEKLDVWLSQVRLNEFVWSNTFYPFASDG